MTKRQYIQYLLATQGNYTCINLAAHLEGQAATRQDPISDFLRREKRTPRGLWEIVAPLLCDSPDAYLIANDSTEDKKHSTKIEMVRPPYSGAEPGLVRGIGVVNLLHACTPAAAEDDTFYPGDYLPEGTAISCASF